MKFQTYPRTLIFRNKFSSDLPSNLVCAQVNVADQVSVTVGASHCGALCGVEKNHCVDIEY